MRVVLFHGKSFSLRYQFKCVFLWRGLRCKNCEHSGWFRCLGIIWLQGLWTTLVCWTVRRFHRFYNHMHIKWLICLALFAYTRPMPCLRMAWLIVSLVGVAPTVLTHLGRDKMAVISQPKFSNAFFSLKNVWISINISLKFVRKGKINNIPPLVQIMAWCRPGSKELSERMMFS